MGGVLEETGPGGKPIPPSPQTFVRDLKSLGIIFTKTFKSLRTSYTNGKSARTSKLHSELSGDVLTRHIII